MKKTLAVTLAFIMAVSLFAITGCAGDTAKAKEYMQKGDELSVELKTYVEETKADIPDLLVDFGIDVATGAIKSEDVVDEAKKQIDSLIENGEMAIAEYKKILDLDDVEDYKEYANLRIDALESTIEVLKKLKDLLDTLMTASNEGKDLGEAVTEWGKENTDVLADIGKAAVYWVQANNLKNEKNL